MTKTDDTTLFDYAEGIRLKNEGKAISVDSRRRILAIAKATALEIGCNGASVDMDMVRELMQKRGQPHDLLGNAAGSVFKPEKGGPVWEFVGFIHSRRPIAHDNLLRRWKRSDR